MEEGKELSCDVDLLGTRNDTDITSNPEMGGSVNFEGCDLPMKISIAPTDSLAITSDPPTTSAQTTARNNPQTATNSLMDASYLTQDDLFKNLELDSNLVEM